MRTRDATATVSSSKAISKDSSRDSNKVNAVSKGSKVKKVDKDKKDRKANRLNRASAAKTAGRDPSRVNSKRADRKTVVRPTVTATVVVWTIGEMLFGPVTGAFVTSLAPERYRGRYMGLWILMWSLGLLLGPMLGTMLYQWSHTALWIACAVLGVIAALLALVRPRRATVPAAITS